MKSFITYSLAWCLLLASSAVSFSQQSGTSPAQKSIAKIKQRVEEIGLNGDITVILASGVEIYGSIKNIEDDRFFVAEVDRVNLAEINYGDVKKVRKNYGGKGISGKRVNPRTSLIAGAAVLGGIIAIAFIAAAGAK